MSLEDAPSSAAASLEEYEAKRVEALKEKMKEVYEMTGWFTMGYMQDPIEAKKFAGKYNYTNGTMTYSNGELIHIAPYEKEVVDAMNEAGMESDSGMYCPQWDDVLRLQSEKR